MGSGNPLSVLTARSSLNTINRMVKSQVVDTPQVATSHTLDVLFGAMASPARRFMLARLSQGSAIVSELGNHLDMSPPAVSKHLRVLEDAGLVKRIREGRTQRIRLLQGSLEPAAEFMGQFWSDSFDALTAHLEAEEDPVPRERKP